MIKKFIPVELQEKGISQYMAADENKGASGESD
jgi:hypothetical protein